MSARIARAVSLLFLALSALVAVGCNAWGKKKTWPF